MLSGSWGVSGKYSGPQMCCPVSLDTGVDVVPFADLGQTLDVVVGHVHPSCVANLSVDDHDLTVVAMGGVVEPGEGEGIEFHDFDALLADGFQVFLGQRFVVRQIAESVEQGTHFYAFLYLLGQ